jgi:hypothetical protein
VPSPGHYHIAPESFGRDFSPQRPTRLRGRKWFSRRSRVISGPQREAARSRRDARCGHSTSLPSRPPASIRMELVLSEDITVKHGPSRNREFARLAAGGKWIRTSGSACDARATRGDNRRREPPSPDYLRLLSADITEGGPKRSLGTEALSRAEPEVRIHFPPAESRVRTRLRGFGDRRPR